MITEPGHNRFIDIHSHNPVNEEGIIRIYNLNLEDYEEGSRPGPFSTGLHPWHIGRFSKPEEIRSMLGAAARDGSVIAIGETGVDKIITTGISEQEEIFRIHAEVAENAGKPLIIHCVKGFGEILRIRKETAASVPWILHGYNSSRQMAEEMISKGFYISIGKKLLDNREKSSDILRNIPVSYIFTETDEDATDIRIIYDQIALIYGISVEELKENIRVNFLKVFGE